MSAFPPSRSGRRVLASTDSPDGSRCVDVFVRDDGTFGFEEFRRDAEDLRGWFPVGGHLARVFGSEADARRAAASAVPWLAGG
jgi:hypothetical protein